MASTEEMSASDWSVIKVVWKLQPCPAQQVYDSLKGRTKWSYSTVRTLLDRMVAKRVLTTVKTDGLIHYCAAISEEKAKAGELKGTLKRVFDGALGSMVQCLI